MRVWLPPSESKTPPESGPFLDLGALVHPGLAELRLALVEALAKLGSGADARAILGLGPTNAREAEANARILEAPCAPARELYTGVLFDALDLPSLTGDEAERANASTRIFSGLFGVVSPADRIPDHRLAIGARLPGIGPLAAYWRDALDAALRAESEGECVVDARSGGYAAACRATWADLVSIGAVRVANGKRSVISHDAKRWRGLACRGLYSLPEGAGRADVLESLASLAGGASIEDAKGTAHAVVDVEIDEGATNRHGGSRAEAILVTD